MFGEKGGNTYEDTTDLCGNEKKKEKAEKMKRHYRKSAV